MRKNDRRCIGAASNEGIIRRIYPASHDNVLGVSAIDYDPNRLPYSIWYNLVQDDASNYFPSAIHYEVSGIYICGTRHVPWRKPHGEDPRLGLGWVGTIPILPGFEGIFPGTWNSVYDDFGGASAAVPQFAA